MIEKKNLMKNLTKSQNLKKQINKRKTINNKIMNKTNKK
jgi:hypothetical protein